MTEIELQEIENPLGLKLVLRLFFLILLDAMLMDICFAKNPFERGCYLDVQSTHR